MRTNVVWNYIIILNTQRAKYLERLRHLTYPLPHLDHIAQFTYFAGKGRGPVGEGLVVVAFKSFPGSLYIDGPQGCEIKFH